jgi:hypothetical protein
VASTWPEHPRCRAGRIEPSRAGAFCAPGTPHNPERPDPNCPSPRPLSLDTLVTTHPQITSFGKTSLATKFPGERQWAKSKRAKYLPLKRSPPEPHPDSGVLLEVHVTGKPQVPRNRQSYIEIRTPHLVAREHLTELKRGTAQLATRSFEVVRETLKTECGVEVAVEQRPKPAAPSPRPVAVPQAALVPQPAARPPRPVPAPRPAQRPVDDDEGPTLRGFLGGALVLGVVVFAGLAGWRVWRAWRARSRGL